MKKIFNSILGQQDSDDSNHASHPPSYQLAFIGKNFVVGHYNLHVEDVIAEGGFGMVFKVRSAQGELFAMKRMCVNNEQDLSVIKREITIVSSLSHKNIIRYVDSKIVETQRDISEVILVTAYYPITLSQIVQEKKSRNSRFNEEEVLQIICDMMEAVSRLHHCLTPIIHRDLKIENILLDQRRNNYVLCDFGSATSRILCPSLHGYQRCQEEIARYTTLAYRAPEMVDLYADNGSINLGLQTDIWALGVLAYCLCFFIFPFGDNSSLGIQSGSFTIPDSSNFSDKMHKLINYMLTYNWRNRPDIYQVSFLAFTMVARKTPVQNINQLSIPSWQELEAPLFESSEKQPVHLLKPTNIEIQPNLRDSVSPNRFTKDQKPSLQTSIAPRERPKPKNVVNSVTPFEVPPQKLVDSHFDTEKSVLENLEESKDPWQVDIRKLSDQEIISNEKTWLASFDTMQIGDKAIKSDFRDSNQSDLLIDINRDTLFGPHHKLPIQQHRRLLSDTSMLKNGSNVINDNKSLHDLIIQRNTSVNSLASGFRPRPTSGRSTASQSSLGHLF